MNLPLRDELEGILRGWNAYELSRGAAPIIDFDFRPDLTDAVCITSRLEALSRCSSVLSRAEAEGDYWVAARARADATYLRALLGERPPIEEYLARTQGCVARPWPEDYLDARRSAAIAHLGALGVAWGPATADDHRQVQGPISVEEAEEQIRKASEGFADAVRAVTGATAQFTLSIETADVDAYWGYWLDGAGSNVRLRLNLRHSRFTETRARQFALHEVLGHGLQSANIAQYSIDHEVPWVRLCSVHGPDQVLLEGIAQAMPLFVAPDDAELEACVRLDHYLQLVRGNLHLAVNRGTSLADCVDYARRYVPFWDDEDISDLLTDRTVNPLLQSYLWAYPAGIDWFVNLAEAPAAPVGVLADIYRQPLTPARLQALWPDGPQLVSDDNKGGPVLNP